jgi:hypothetical protein
MSRVLTLSTIVTLIQQTHTFSPYLLPMLALIAFLHPTMVISIGLLGSIYYFKSKLPVEIGKKTRAPRKKNISKAVKDAVWNKYIGIEVGLTKCPMCDNYCISQNNFHCGHVIAESNGGLAIVKNLRPICAGCNLSMQSQNMIDFARQKFPRSPILQSRYELNRPIY